MTVQIISSSSQIHAQHPKGSAAINYITVRAAIIIGKSLTKTGTASLHFQKNFFLHFRKLLGAITIYTVGLERSRFCTIPHYQATLVAAIIYKATKIAAAVCKIPIKTRFYLQKRSFSNFEYLPHDVIISIFECLGGNRFCSLQGDYQAITSAIIVCKNWQETIKSDPYFFPFLKREWQLSKEYQKEIVALFKKISIGITRLPMIKLEDEIEQMDYPFVDSEKMPHSIVRFRTKDGRPGIALRIQAHPPIIKKAKSLPKTWDLSKGILAIFKRYKDPESKTWTFTLDPPIESLYQKRHEESSHIEGEKGCANCFSSQPEFNKTALALLLERRDPDFSILEYHQHPLYAFIRSQT